MQYHELFNALNAFRQLFTNRLVPVNEINHCKDFLKQIAERGNAEMTFNEAFRLYKIIQPYSAKLKQVNFNFDDVPKVGIQVNQPVVKPQDHNVIGYDGTQYIVKLKYNEELVNKMRLITGRSYDAQNRVWKVPTSSTKELKEFAQGNDFDIGELAFKMMTDINDNLEMSYSAEAVELGIATKMQFYPYQTVGVDYVRKNKRVIIADQMGLGKTSQGIGGVLINNSFPCLVVCPKSLRLNWSDEWAMWTNKKTLILSHKNIDKMPMLIERGMVDVVIVNYDGVRTFFVDEIKEVQITEGARAGTSYKKVVTNGREKLFKGIILDESHNCKNRTKLRFKSIKKCFDDKDTRICLTGTPIVKGPQDLAALLDLCGRLEEFGGYHKFNKQYKGLDKKFLNIDTSKTASKKDIIIQRELKALNVKLRSTCFIRREKHQVLKDLPEKFRKVIRVPLENQKEYDHAYFSLQSYLAQIGASHEKMYGAQQAETLVKVQILKQLSSKGKLDAVKEFAEDLIEQGEKMIIVCWFNETVQMLKDALKQFGVVTISGKIDGRDTRDEEIQEAKKKFMNDPSVNIIIITYGKGGEGHTLTAASKVLIVELGWTYKDQGQVEDRAHRIGQKSEVECYYFIGQDTIDEHIYNIINSRMMLEKEATGGSEEIETTFTSLIAKIAPQSVN